MDVDVPDGAYGSILRGICMQQAFDAQRIRDTSDFDILREAGGPSADYSLLAGEKDGKLLNP